MFLALELSRIQFQKNFRLRNRPVLSVGGQLEGHVFQSGADIQRLCPDEGTVRLLVIHNSPAAQGRHVKLVSCLTFK